MSGNDHVLIISTIIFWRLLGRFENFAISPYGHHKIRLVKQFQQRIIRVDCVSLLSRISHAFQEANKGSLKKG